MSTKVSKFIVHALETTETGIEIGLNPGTCLRMLMDTIIVGAHLDEAEFLEMLDEGYKSLDVRDVRFATALYEMQDGDATEADADGSGASKQPVSPSR